MLGSKLSSVEGVASAKAVRTAFAPGSTSAPIEPVCTSSAPAMSGTGISQHRSKS